MHKLLTAVFIAMFSFNVSAALVSNGSYTTDTVSELDWLDLGLTADMTRPEALAANSGWRYATNAEVEDLFAQSFVGYFSTEPQKFYIGSGGESDPQYDNYAEFTSLFGPSAVFGDNLTYSYGLYEDEDNIIRVLGAHYDSSWEEVRISGTEMTHSYNDIYSSWNMGTYLVRTTAVPVPGAVWLFGSALAGLGWLRRKQTA